MAFHRIHFLANETPSSKSLNHFNLFAPFFRKKVPKKSKRTNHATATIPRPRPFHLQRATPQ
jgi:hypothetical protein